MSKVKLVLGALSVAILILSLTSYFFGIPVTIHKEGRALDELNGVKVYYNGEFSHVEGRNTTTDGYNIGLQWQCVEFVKRYYLEVYGHKMINSYGNAIDMFNPEYANGELNIERGLIQYSNPSSVAPQVGDILVLNGGFGHVAIISQTSESEVQVIQQNVGYQTRAEYKLQRTDSKYEIMNARILGWLRMPH